MTPDTALIVAVLIVAALLAAIEVFRTRGQDLVAWAVLLIALALIPGRQL